MKLYDFETGRTIEPDFVLYLRKEGQDTSTILQLFIKPKGDQLRPQHKKLTVHHLYMSGVFPVALVRSGKGYQVKCIQIDHPDAIRLPEDKRLR